MDGHKQQKVSVSLWLQSATQDLSKAGISTGRLDSLVLLEDVTRHDRAWLLAHPGQSLTSAQQTKLTKLLRRRSRHEPLAYIRGFTEFYGRKFVITPAVLEPRPESETMIDLLKSLLPLPRHELAFGSDSFQSNYTLRIADVGSGSGALGITAKLEAPEAAIELLEIDSAALKISKANVDKFTLDIKIVHSDLLAQANSHYHILLCNLPYVPDNYHINEAASQEPRLAIFGGSDGLDIYRNLFQQLSEQSKQPLFILTESLPPQHAVLQTIAAAHGYKPYQSEDFIQVFASI